MNHLKSLLLVLIVIMVSNDTSVAQFGRLRSLAKQKKESATQTKQTKPNTKSNTNSSTSTEA